MRYAIIPTTSAKNTTPPATLPPIIAPMLLLPDRSIENHVRVRDEWGEDVLVSLSIRSFDRTGDGSYMEILYLSRFQTFDQV